MIDLKDLSKKDPVKRKAEKDKGLENTENSPMDPPGAYDTENPFPEISYDKMSKVLQTFIDEHQKAIPVIDAFEKALAQFKEAQYQLTDDINTAFRDFFEYFDNNVIQHNLKEEKVLFPQLHKKLIAAGEHGEGEKPKTAIDLMEDDHIKFIQLGVLAFNMLGLGSRLQDMRSKLYVFDIAYNNGKELVEMLRLHIFREENTLFPLAQMLFSKEELEAMNHEMENY